MSVIVYILSIGCHCTFQNIYVFWLNYCTRSDCPTARRTVLLRCRYHPNMLLGNRYRRRLGRSQFLQYLSWPRCFLPASWKPRCYPDAVTRNYRTPVLSTPRTSTRPSSDTKFSWTAYLEHKILNSWHRHYLLVCFRCLLRHIRQFRDLKDQTLE